MSTIKNAFIALLYRRPGSIPVHSTHASAVHSAKCRD